MATDLDLSAGRELDALIEERIFDNPVDREFDEPRVPARRDQYDEWGFLPAYSTEIGAAWDVVDAMIALVEAKQYTRVALTWHGPLYKPSDHYLTNEGYPLGTVCWYVLVERFGWRLHICAETPPLAICRAALAVQNAKTMRAARDRMHP